jgi:hypothetical protein
MKLSLCRAILGLISAWCHSDRVRISPREGELLRLRPGSVVQINGTVAEVRSQSFVQKGQTTRVRYDCQTESGPAQLEVQCHAVDNRVVIVWSTDGRKELLFQHQIEMFG